MKSFSCLLFRTACFVLLFSSLALAYPVPDTGPTLCYDENGQETPCEGSGQDGAFSINPISYTKLDGDGTELSDDATEWAAARDNVTGLVWEVKNEANKAISYPWGDAPDDATHIYVNDYIKTLNAQGYAGRKNWRMPTIVELILLGTRIDRNDTIKIDTTIFPNTQSEMEKAFWGPPYWSCTRNYLSPDDVMHVFVSSAFVSSSSNTVNQNPDCVATPLIRAVSGFPLPGESRFTNNDDGTITDASTGLMWEQERTEKYGDEGVPVRFTRKQSLDYCASLELAGHTDWRLPTCKEMISLVNFRGVSNLVYARVFPNLQADKGNIYWTASFNKSYYPEYYFRLEGPVLISFEKNPLISPTTMEKAEQMASYVLAVRGGQPIKDGHLVIDAPKQGADIEPGEPALIEWRHFDQAIQGNVAIDFSIDGGKHFDVITDSVENTGNYTWQVPLDISSVNCMLRVTPTALEHEREGTTQGLFRIGPQAKIKLGIPTGHTCENGITTTFPISLQKQPDGKVVVTLSVDNPSEGFITSETSLTFTPENFSTPQEVSIEGIDDNIADGSVTYQVIIAIDKDATEDTTGYSMLKPAQVSLVNDDNDIAKLVASLISGDTSESGTKASFTVRLSSEPTGKVYVKLVNLGTREISIDADHLLFTPSNWDHLRSVQVTGLPDNKPDGDTKVEIGLNIDKTETLDMSGYRDLKRHPIYVTNINIDPGLIARPYCNEGYHYLNLTEDGGTAKFSVRLRLAPSANVTLDIVSTDPSEGVVSPQKLVFTPLNWNTEQFVTATGVDDFIIEDPLNPQKFQIIVRPNKFETEDTSGYADAPEAIIDHVKNVDNNDWERIGLAVSDISGDVTEDGGSATFSVALNTVPDGDVIVDVTISNESEAIVSPATLIITPQDWNVKKTVTVTGVPDNKEDGEKEVTVHLIVNAASPDTTGYKDTSDTDIAFKSKDASPTAGETEPETDDGSDGGGCFIQSLHLSRP